MRKPRKPRKPTPVLYYLGEPKAPKTNSYRHNLSLLTKEILKKASEELKIPIEQVKEENIYLESSGYWGIPSIYYSLCSLTDKEVRHSFNEETLKKVKKYRKSLERYETKFKQYIINQKVWNAWKLKNKKDELLDKMSSLKKELSKLEQKIEFIVDQ